MQNVHKRRWLWRYNILLDCIRIESTDGNFGTHEKVVIHIAIVTCALPIRISIFGIQGGLKSKLLYCDSYLKGYRIVLTLNTL